MNTEPRQTKCEDPEAGIIMMAMVRSEFGDGQPRVRDLDLGEWLGYAHPIAIRKVIRDNRPEIKALGVISVLEITAGPSGGRPGEEFWLTGEQAIAVCQLSQTSPAADVRIALRTGSTERRSGVVM